MHYRLLDTDVKRDALELAKAGLWDDAGPEQAIAQAGAGGGTLANSQVGTRNDQGNQQTLVWGSYISPDRKGWWARFPG